MQVRERKYAILLLGMAFYAVALFLPALDLSVHGYQGAQHFEQFTGLSILKWAPIAMVYGNFAAIANPLLWLSWALFVSREFRGARTVSIFALLASLLTIQLIFKPLPLDEGGVNLAYLHYPLTGFFCWILSMVIVLVASIKALREA
jgi:hypothetical protein